MNNAVARMSDVTRIINDTNETHQLARDPVNGAQSEVLMLFSAENGFKRILEAGNDQLILAAARRGVIVTLLAPMNESRRMKQKNLKNRMRIYQLEVLSHTLHLSVGHLRLS